METTAHRIGRIVGSPNRINYILAIMLAGILLFGGWLAMSIQDEIDYLNSEVSDVEWEVSNLDSGLSDLYSEVNELEAQVSDLESQVSDLESELSDFQSLMSRVVCKLTNRYNDC